MKKKNLTVEDVKAYVKALKKNAKEMDSGSDATYIALACQEHLLFMEVLQNIAKEKGDHPVALAQEALKSLKVKFPRKPA